MSPPAVDKRRLAGAFGRGAAAYDAATPVQAHARARLLAMLPGLLPPPRRALDVGTGTGALLAALRARWPAARVTGLDLAHGMAAAARARGAGPCAVGDAEALPFAAGSFDLVLSTSALQWVASLERALVEARRVLAPGRRLAVALFGGETLHELRAAWRAALPAGAPDRTHRFHRLADLERALVAAGLAPERVEEERVVERHPDAYALVATLRRIGAGNPRAAGEAGPAAFHRMARLYAERHGGPEGIAATWDVLYAVARRA